jgi:hypothetical protein
MQSFTSKIQIIGVNPYVLLPSVVLKNLFKEAGKTKGPIPIRGTLNDQPFVQTLVKFSGKWRLYLNTPMRKAANIDVGDIANVTIEVDLQDRTVPIHVKLQKALKKNSKAYKVFVSLPPSRQKEIARYINHLKTEESVNRNIEKVIKFLLGKERFVGRDTP